jgi:hypothetical protein
MLWQMLVNNHVDVLSSLTDIYKTYHTLSFFGKWTEAMKFAI